MTAFDFCGFWSTLMKQGCFLQQSLKKTKTNNKLKILVYLTSSLWKRGRTFGRTRWSCLTHPCGSGSKVAIVTAQPMIGRNKTWHSVWNSDPVSQSETAALTCDIKPTNRIDAAHRRYCTNVTGSQNSLWVFIVQNLQSRPARTSGRSTACTSHAFKVWLCCEFSGLHKSIEKTNNLHVWESKSCTILWVYLKFLSCHVYKPISRPREVFQVLVDQQQEKLHVEAARLCVKTLGPVTPSTIHANTTSKNQLEDPLMRQILVQVTQTRTSARPPTRHVDVTWQRWKESES